MFMQVNARCAHQVRPTEALWREWPRLVRFLSGLTGLNTSSVRPQALGRWLCDPRQGIGLGGRQSEPAATYEVKPKGVRVLPFANHQTRADQAQLPG